MIDNDVLDIKENELTIKAIQRKASADELDQLIEIRKLKAIQGVGHNEF